MEQEGGGRVVTTPSKSKTTSNRTQERHRRQFDNFKSRLNELGWRTGFIESHVGINVGRELDERRESLLLESYAKLWIPKTLANKTDEDIEDILYASGLQRRKTPELSNIIKPLYKTCYSYKQLIEIAIEYALGKYTKISKPGQAFLFDQPQHDTWTPNATFKYIYNVLSTTTDNKLNQNQICNTLPGRIDINTLYFHATNYASAMYIAKNGIAHLKGRECLDFGIQPAFYMTPDISAAFEWCSKNNSVWQKEACILVFSIPPDSSTALTTKSFSNATDEWVDLVTSSRKCQDTLNALDWFDAVYGPMAANVHAITKQGSTSLARPHKKIKYQLASKSNSSDLYYRNCMIAAIFLKCL